MGSLLRTMLLAVALATLVGGTHAQAQFQVEIDFDGSLQPAIVDNGAGDLNPASDFIDFDITDTVNTALSARGRITHESGPVGHILKFTAITPDANGVLRNAGATDAAFTMTIRSAAYSAVGPPLGWALSHRGEVADPLPDVVSATLHSSTLAVDDEVTPLATILVPDITGPGDPPVPFDPYLVPSERGSDPAADATSSQAVLTVTLGPGDEYRSQAESDQGELSFVAHVYNQERKCVLKMNQLAGKAAKYAFKDDERCVKHADESPVLACVEDVVSGRVERVEEKITVDFFPAYCVAPPPAWGANIGSCCEDSANEGADCGSNDDCGSGICAPGACIAGALIRASDGIMHDLFGSAITVDNTERCTTKVVRAASKVVSERWKTFYKCKKDNIQAIDNDVDLVAQCLTGSETAVRPVKAELKLDDAVSDCVLAPASAFPGDCASAPSVAGCVIERTRCRFCQSVNVADDIVPPFDCDGFDNGAADLSCTDAPLATTTTSTTSTTL
jgi:hypothetical protein